MPTGKTSDKVRQKHAKQPRQQTPKGPQHQEKGQRAQLICERATKNEERLARNISPPNKQSTSEQQRKEDPRRAKRDGAPRQQPAQDWKPKSNSGDVSSTVCFLFEVKVSQHNRANASGSGNARPKIFSRFHSLSCTSTLRGIYIWRILSPLLGRDLYLSLAILQLSLVPPQPQIQSDWQLQIALQESCGVSLVVRWIWSSTLCTAS